MARRLAALLLVLCAPALAACGSKSPDAASEITGDAVTVYSSLPLTGPLAPAGRDLVKAEKLALLEAGGRVGDVAVGYVSLDSADPRTGGASPDRVAANARAAIQDRQTIAYLGELEAGASATSLPVLNAGGIAQVSPGDTDPALTGERFAPSGVPTFARVARPSRARAAAFARRFESAFGRRPHPRAVLGYDAMRLVLRAMTAAGDGKARRRVVAREVLRASSR
jgi:ABC-type branched-subunit amino acid transport system substrate-binding protein